MCPSQAAECNAYASWHQPHARHACPDRTPNHIHVQIGRPESPAICQIGRHMDVIQMAADCHIGRTAVSSQLLDPEAGNTRQRRPDQEAVNMGRWRQIGNGSRWRRRKPPGGGTEKTSRRHTPPPPSAGRPASFGGGEVNGGCVGGLPRVSAEAPPESPKATREVRFAHLSIFGWMQSQGQHGKEVASMTSIVFHGSHVATSFRPSIVKMCWDLKIYM